MSFLVRLFVLSSFHLKIIGEAFIISWGKSWFCFGFLMHGIPNECKKDNTVYHLKLHVSNRSPVFQMGELYRRLFDFFFASRSQSTCLHTIRCFIPVTVLTLCYMCSAGPYLTKRNFSNLLSLDVT